jgi:hypothetical protein
MRLAFHDASVGQPSANGNIFDRLIQWRTGSPYVHVELVSDQRASGRDTWWSFSAVPGAGVRWTRIDITEPWWKVIPLPALPIGRAGPAMMGQRTDQLIGQSYDWLGILGFGVPWSQHDDNDKFCSEACTLVLQAAGLFPGVASWRVSPADLFAMVVA